MMKLVKLVEGVRSSSGSERWKSVDVAYAINGHLLSRHNGNLDAVNRELVKILGQLPAETVAELYNDNCVAEGDDGPFLIENAAPVTPAP
jgi:hypothetical protein